MTVEPGPDFVTRLREALSDAPAAPRILIETDLTPEMRISHPPPPAGPVGPRERRFSAKRAFETFEQGRVGAFTIPVSDTVKEVVDGMVRRTVPRETLVQVIGPWVFDREALVEAMTRVAGAESVITDMIGFCEAAKVRVRAMPTP